MAEKNEPQYRIVVKLEEGTNRTIYNDDEGRPLTEETWEAEYEYWSHARTIDVKNRYGELESIEIVGVSAYKGTRRIG